MPVILNQYEQEEWLEGKDVAGDTYDMIAHKVAPFGLNDEGENLIEEW